MEIEQIPKFASKHNIRPNSVELATELGVPDQDMDAFFEARKSATVPVNKDIKFVPSVKLMADLYHLTASDGLERFQNFASTFNEGFNKSIKENYTPDMLKTMTGNSDRKNIFNDGTAFFIGSMFKEFDDVIEVKAQQIAQQSGIDVDREKINLYQQIDPTIPHHPRYYSEVSRTREQLKLMAMAFGDITPNEIAHRSTLTAIQGTPEIVGEVVKFGITNRHLRNIIAPWKQSLEKLEENDMIVGSPKNNQFSTQYDLIDAFVLLYDLSLKQCYNSESMDVTDVFDRKIDDYITAVLQEASNRLNRFKNSYRLSQKMPLVRSDVFGALKAVLDKENVTVSEIGTFNDFVEARQKQILSSMSLF